MNQSWIQQTRTLADERKNRGHKDQIKDGDDEPRPFPNRIYFFDNKYHVDPELKKKFTELEQFKNGKCEIWGRKCWWDGVREFPINDIIDTFKVDYFGCSVSYLIAHAMYEKCTEIELEGVLYTHDSLEYFQQKANVEFWLAIALAVGIKVFLPKNTMLMHNWPWEAQRYGYQIQTTRALGMHTMACALRSTMAYPRRTIDADSDESQDLNNLHTWSGGMREMSKQNIHTPFIMELGKMREELEHETG